MDDGAVLAQFERFSARLLASVSAHPDILGLVWVGSAADLGRVDEWSDHDFFLVARPGSEEHLREHLDWLPDAGQIAIAVRETEHGLKVVYRGGHVLEFAVASPEQLSTFSANTWTVALDREVIARRMSNDVGPARNELESSRHGDPVLERRLFLVNVLIGVGRARRGELLSAGQSVRSSAVGHLLRAVAGALPGDRPERLDDLDPWRRFERVYPQAGRLIAAALDQEVEPGARALLDAAELLLAGTVAEFAAGETDVVRHRLGW